MSTIPQNDLDRVTFDWWANGNHHRAYSATRGFHGRMVAYANKNKTKLDIIVGKIEEQYTRYLELEQLL